MQRLSSIIRQLRMQNTVSIFISAAVLMFLYVNVHPQAYLRALCKKFIGFDHLTQELTVAKHNSVSRYKSSDKCVSLLLW